MKLFVQISRIITVILFSLTIAANANSIKLSSQENDLQITQNTGSGFNITYSFSEFNTLEIKTDRGIFTKFQVAAYARNGEFGHPELPVKSQLIEIPVGASVQVNILSSTIKEYKLNDLGITYPLFPNQPPVPKTGDIPPFIYEKEAYKIDAYTQSEIVSVEDLGIMRGVRVGRLDIMPVQYNPVTGMIRVYENLEVEVVFEDADLAATALNKSKYSNHYFAPVFNTLVNYTGPDAAARENLSQYPIKYVIVSDPMFEDQLQPFIEWKIKKGFTVIEAYTNDPNVGTTTAHIKAYLRDLYENGTPEDPAPTFVLFVGDVAQIPVFYGQAGHETDLYYCEFTGDYFPEMFYGRFSAQNTSQLQPQIDKTLMVEQYTMPVTSYLDTVVMIAGMDGTFGPVHGNGQINYGTENYFNAAHGIYSHTYLYPESGNNSATIRQNISDGVAFANYTAHGSPDGWADPSFTVSNIPALQNTGKYGLLIGNCCSTSEYEVGICFGEAIVRAANKGAVGYIGASNSTFWNEDYYFGVGVGTISGDPPSYEETTLGDYDRMFHTHGEPFEEWYTTMDQVVFAGNLAVTLGTPGSAEYYWEAYCLMGDPSLAIYMTEPPEMPVSYNPIIPPGYMTFVVNAVPYAYVGLSMNGTGLGAALADSEGIAVMTLAAVPDPGIADVVVTAHNYQPFVGTVMTDTPEGPYVILNEFIINDENGDNDGLIEFGEDILLDVELKNWGGDDAVNATATLSTEDEFVSLTDDMQDYGTIIVQDSVMATDAFQFEIDALVPDMHKVHFNLTIQDETRGMWNSSFPVTLYAPVLSVGSMLIDDSEGGNGNYRLDPGESVNIIVDCNNSGHCDALNSHIVLQSSSPYITLGTTSCTFDTLNGGGMKQAVFTATLADEIETGTLIDLTVNLSSNPYSDTKLFYPMVGPAIEDFETGNFESFEWEMAGNQPWQITESQVFEGIYSARSGVIGDGQTSKIEISMEVALDDSISFCRKVSCENDPEGENYDWLGFFIDGTEIERWDGEVGWGYVAYPVTAGEHTFKWIFNKDYSVAGGADAVWLDNIVFPVMAPAVSTGEEPKGAVTEFSIIPNPASDKTALYISLDEATSVTVDIYDIAGNRIRREFAGLMLPVGQNRLELQTSGMAPGVYFCRMNADGYELTRKLIIKN